MYCKRIDTDGPVFLYTPLKQRKAEFVRCNADGSAFGEAQVVVAEPEVAPKPPKAPKPSKVPKASKIAAIEDYESGSELQIVQGETGEE